jgi:hypothetical protein
MGLRWWRFAATMFTSVTMSAALCHLMELPPKMRYDASLYVKLHRTLYPNFGRIAGITEILSVIANTGLALWVRKRRPAAFPLTAASAACVLAADGAFWALVNPANRTMASWPLESIPAEWTGWRDQWEYTHAARAFLMMGALGTLVLSLVRETPEGTDRDTR